MNVDDFFQTFLPAIEGEMQRQVARLDEQATQPFHQMLTYHLGWTGPGAGPQARGKRIRPVLALLFVAAYKERWEKALPVAAAIELVHNFSLAHDDIQDNADLRRGRLTLWKRWGAPHAINAGDALFVLAHLAALDLAIHYPAATVLQASRILQEACLALTRGQFLDMYYENQQALGTADYWPMVEGKTAALISASTAIGALLGGASAAEQEASRQFGRLLGLAFQVQDDLLGIWGDETQTGKSVASDLLAGKKTLPVLYGLQQRGPFWQRWQQGPLTPEEVPALAAELQREGAREYTRQTAGQLTDRALQALQEANLQGEAGQAVQQLALRLLKRDQ